MMKLQKIILCCAVAPAAFGASLGLIELGNYARALFVSPKLSAESETPRTISAPPTIVPPTARFEIPSSVPENAPVAEPEYEWSETGNYYLSGTGKAPKGFEDFDCLAIVTRVWDGEKKQSVAVKPSGEIYTLRDQKSEQYEFSAININGKRIAIVTRRVKGVSFQFDGKFVEEKVNYNAAGIALDTEIKLKGRITKWRGGKKIAEASIKLEVGGC